LELQLGVEQMAIVEQELAAAIIMPHLQMDYY